jgi:hypothetical protein
VDVWYIYGAELTGYISRLERICTYKKKRRHIAMKTIEILEEAAENRKGYAEININSTFGAAYFYSREAGNDLINFNDVIWDYDIDEIIENCRRFGIGEFTISSTFSSLIETIAEFEKRGLHLDGLVEINSRFDDWKAEKIGVKRRIPAFKMSL